MTPRMTAVLERAESARHALLDFVGNIPVSLMLRRPANGGWSPAQILEHLRLSEAGITRLLAHRLMRAREQGLGPVMQLASDPADRVVFPPGTVEAPEAIRPAANVHLETVIDGLRAARAGLRALADDVDRHDATKVTARHIVLGELHFYQWIDFVGAHEDRHRAQIAAIVSE